MIKEKKVRCRECESSFIYVKKDGTVVCRSCGSQTKLREGEEGEDGD